MRIRCLLFLLSTLMLLAGARPLHAALSVAPHCLPPAPPKGTTKFANAEALIPRFSQALDYDLEERDYLIRTIAFEASGETEVGKAAVAHVILNRKRSGNWGDNIKEVVTHPWQFEPWMTKRKQMERLSPDDPRYREAALIADAVLAGQMADPTGGATHFLNPIIVRERRGGSLPSWARGKGQPIGRHTFYAPHEGVPTPKRAALSLESLRDRFSC